MQRVAIPVLVEMQIPSPFVGIPAKFFFSFCSDMGTEINLAGFRINEIQGLLLPWLQTVDLHSDIDAYDESGDGLMNLESDVAAVEFELGMEEQGQIIPHVADVPMTEDGGTESVFCPIHFLFREYCMWSTIH